MEKTSWANYTIKKLLSHYGVIKSIFNIRRKWDSTNLLGYFMSATCQTSSCKHLNGGDRDRIKGMEHHVNGRIAL